MANERNPNDPYARDAAEKTPPLHSNQQPQPATAASSANGGRMAIFAVAIVVVLGAIFYGVNSSKAPTATSSTTPQSTSQGTAQNNASNPPAAPGMRNVTPSGTTTGTAPASPTQPAPAAPAPAK